MQFPIKRTPEEGHTPACWTAAITASLESQRDAEVGDVEFRIWLQQNGPLRMAEDLLREGSTACLCPEAS